MTANQAILEKYRNNFLKEVEANVAEGEWVKMCMQCGVCQMNVEVYQDDINATYGTKFNMPIDRWSPNWDDFPT